MLRNVFLVVALAGVALVSACALMPERFVVNAPWLQQVFARAEAPDVDTLQSRIRLPEGYEISVFAEGLDNPRMLLWSGGNLLVSEPRVGEVALLRPSGDGKSAVAEVALEGLDSPHGLAERDGVLYVAGEGSVYAAEWDAGSGAVMSEAREIASLPPGGGHWTRTIKRGPDGRLYVAAGSSCNVCVEDDWRRAALMVLDPDSGALTLFADGLRNTVGWDWRPADGGLYGVDNGRDWLGDDEPPDELNRIEEGGFYGWPFVNGFGVVDPDYGGAEDARIAAARSPEYGFQAHVAPLSILFVKEGAGLPGLEGAALVALHGSWNRSVKVGYKLVSLHWDAAGDISERDFAVGWEVGGEVIGRPVDVVLGPDGALYVSDDFAGAVYRIAWKP